MKCFIAKNLIELARMLSKMFKSFSLSSSMKLRRSILQFDRYFRDHLFKVITNDVKNFDYIMLSFLLQRNKIFDLHKRAQMLVDSCQTFNQNEFSMKSRKRFCNNIEKQIVYFSNLKVMNNCSMFDWRICLTISFDIRVLIHFMKIRDDL